MLETLADVCRKPSRHSKIVCGPGFQSSQSPVSYKASMAVQTRVRLRGRSVWLWCCGDWPVDMMTGESMAQRSLQCGRPQPLLIGEFEGDSGAWDLVRAFYLLRAVALMSDVPRRTQVTVVYVGRLEVIAILLMLF